MNEPQVCQKKMLQRSRPSLLAHCLTSATMKGRDKITGINSYSLHTGKIM